MACACDKRCAKFLIWLGWNKQHGSFVHKDDRIRMIIPYRTLKTHYTRVAIIAVVMRLLWGKPQQLEDVPEE